jgi:hypothetical protein
MEDEEEIDVEAITDIVELKALIDRLRVEMKQCTAEAALHRKEKTTHAARIADFEKQEQTLQLELKTLCSLRRSEVCTLKFYTDNMPIACSSPRSNCRKIFVRE